MGRITLILGGARSGKSARALDLAAHPRTYLATAEAHDEEMQARINAHKEERGEEWALIEAPLDLPEALAGVTGGAVVIDCLTLWLSNLMHAERNIADETSRLIAMLARAPFDAILVSNEIGLGLVPMDALSRAFRDEQGRLNQRVAAAADQVEFVAAGLPLRLK